MKKKIIILGSTGSIGKTFLNILKNDKKNNEIILLTANKNINQLLKQLNIFKVRNIIVTSKIHYLIIKDKLKNKKINVYNDFSSIKKIFKTDKVDYTLNAISGLDGLRPTIEVIKFTKKMCIANKESIICGWSLIKKQLTKYKTEFIPIDSEHFSIWSLVNNIKNKDIEKVFLTASGGPFNDYPVHKFKNINITQALKHPNWKMGKKITIDSSTLMNKVFEIIEAKKIFNYSYNKLHILVHPKSYVHAIVKFKNGLTKILIHDTSMKIPIFNSFYSNFEKTIKTKKLNFDIINNLNFKEVDIIKFPIIKILKKIPNNDSLFETVIVSVNDHLVKMFLEKKITFQDISKNLLKITNMAEFKKYKKLMPRNVEEIEKLNHYVSLNITALCV
jgi:1-deoxy-D-xylulose-5-phosphate reductoisomerase